MKEKYEKLDVFLRIGLGRPYAPKGTLEEKHYLLDTSLYTFP